MDIFQGHLGEWAILLLILGGALYTMRVIGQEQSNFKDECYEVQFEDLSLMIPDWWTITQQIEHSLRFERTDTRYDWYAVFRYLPAHEGKDLPTLLTDKLNQEGIEFDQDVQFETDSRVVFRDPKIQEHFQEMIRVEGKASKNVVDRIYYDIYLMRRDGDEGYFIFESLSSVLNGLVEGPYFEESLACLSFIRESEAGKA